MSIPKFVNMTKNIPFFLILHVFAPLNDVRAYIAWSWKTTLITWFFYADDIQLQIQVAPPGSKNKFWVSPQKKKQNKTKQLKTLEERLNYHLNWSVFKCLSGLAPPGMCNCFTLVSDSHKLNTRSSTLGKIRPMKPLCLNHCNVCHFASIMLACILEFNLIFCNLCKSWLISFLIGNHFTVKTLFKILLFKKRLCLKWLFKVLYKIVQVFLFLFLFLFFW